MDWEKIGKALLFPRTAVLILLLPIATAFLICSMLLIGTKSIIAIISYVLATYTLTVWCMKMPDLFRYLKRLKNNKYVNIWLLDPHLRVNASLYTSLIWNSVYAVFHLVLGFYHRSFWYFSLSGYYISLAAMRLYLVRYTTKHGAGEKLKEELIKYRTCGIAFLATNLALSSMIFFMVYWDRTFIHHEITTITMAAFTFTSLTIAIINVVKYRKYHSPVYSASKAIGLAAASVSMLTLETTMLTTFGNGTMTPTARRIMLSTSGGVLSIFIILMALHMILQGNKNLKKVEKETNESHT